MLWSFGLHLSMSFAVLGSTSDQCLITLADGDTVQYGFIFVGFIGTLKTEYGDPHELTSKIYSSRVDKEFYSGIEPSWHC